MQNAAGDGVRHLNDCGETCGLQKKMFKSAGCIDDTGDKNISDFRQVFIDAGSGPDGTHAHSDKPDIFFRTKRGIDCNDECKWMPRFYFLCDLYDVQSMNRIFQRSVYIDMRPEILGELMTDQRTETITCDAIAADA